jgi:hypothetical protein
MRPFRLLAVFCVVLIWIGHLAADESPTQPAVPVPAWVREEAVDLTTPPATSVPGQILLSDQQDRLTVDGSESYRRIVIRLLNVQGVRANAEWTVEFAPEYEKVEWHRLQVTRGAEVQDRLATTRFKKLQRELGFESQTYTGQATLAAVLDDVRVGDVLDVAYTQTSANPVLRGHIVARHYLGAGYPIQRQRVLLHVVTGAPDVYCSFYLPPGTQDLPGELYRPTALRLALEQEDEPTGKLFRWEGAKLPAIQFDAHMPAQAAPFFPMLQVSSMRSWNDVATWAAGVFAGSAELPEAARALVERWKHDLPTDEARLAAAVQWVQNDVRYFAMAVGDRNLRPRPLREVVPSRYGDCKDKALLLASLLRALGFEAWPALVNTHLRERLDEIAPSPYAFDHAIVAYRLAGRLRWLDATLKNQQGPAGAWELPRYQRALILADDQTALTVIPDRNLSVPDMETRDTITVDSQGSDATLEVETRLTGLQADEYRLRLEAEPVNEIGRRWYNFVARFYRSLEEIDDLTVADDKARNVITFRAKYRIPGFRVAADGNTAGVYAYSLRTSLDPIEGRRRRWPYELEGGRSLRHRIVVNWPDVLQVTGRPEVVVADGIDFRSEKATTGHRCEIVQELRITADYVAANRTDQLSDAVDEILAAGSLTLQPRSASAAEPVKK